MRDLFARWASPTGYTGPVTQASYTGYTVQDHRCNPVTPSNINAVTPVTPVTQKNAPCLPAHDTDQMDNYEERAAILEFDARRPRAEAERCAWLEVFGEEKPVISSKRY